MSLWSQFFGKDPKKLFLEYSPKGSTWRVVSWNFDLSQPGERKWAIETHTPEGVEHIQWLRREEEQVSFFAGVEVIKTAKVPEEDRELHALMNLAIHSTLKHGMEEQQAFMVAPVSGATALDMQNEARALQWIQASFGTLLRALDKIEKDPSLILTAAFFSGVEKSTNERVIRLLAMNLDIFYTLKADHSLQIAIFDDKGAGHGTSKTPSFLQIIKVTKPQFYDEIVKLLHRLAVVGELN